MKNTIGYCRVSTEGQATDGVSLEMQQKKIAVYCDLNELDLVEIIVDAGLSAKTIVGRPGMCKIVELIKSKKIQHFVVYKLDRMSRNLKEACGLSELMQKYGVSLHSITEKIDTGSATGKLFYHMINSMSQWEREIISERTAAALQCKKANGQKVSSRPPYGYYYSDNQAIENPEELACIEHLSALRASTPGLGMKKASRLLEEAGYINRNGVRFGVSSMRVLWKLTGNSGVMKEAA